MIFVDNINIVAMMYLDFDIENPFFFLNRIYQITLKCKITSLKIYKIHGIIYKTNLKI